MNYVISLVRDGQEDKINQMGKDVICVTTKGRPVKAKTVGQQKYVDAIGRNVEGHIRINVDAEDYRQKREDSLRRYAQKKAQQVLKAHRRTTLEPMNAYERHVIHAALQDTDRITTYSVGTEPNRRVVIEYVR